MHEGHRFRLLAKLKSGDYLYEHELLEILLFNAYPRKNVNPVAHALLNRFACIDNVLSAGVDELVTVEGVGENVAMYLNCLGRCLKLKKEAQSFAVIRNTSDLVAFVSARMNGVPHEVLELYFMDKSSRVTRVCSFTQSDPRRVDIRPDEVIKLISVCRPHGLYLAHNHVDTPCEPSPADDDMTKKLQLICSMNNVRFYDHCIYGPDGVYSYFMTNRLDDIIARYSASNFFKDKL